MSANRFEELTRVVVSSTSRRQALKTLAVGVLGGALGFGEIHTARAAGCKSSASTCVHSSDCCSKRCFYSGVAGGLVCA
ncbi:hypothetical protein Krac_6986 [Ktedonobacter racemifer DSM 44963]|uniref:Twin-arginine translocation signal domain-containing protein n=1 Tax=Ktedonobacter racemifer DSM 44963 TaxID=485913 RepID=D6TQA4_KTERA|nr:hypothetical protein Krac_6986 [Ktedonobacter racemifer DSM 44963]